MKQGLTEIVFILDKSGSMCGLEADTIGGYNSFLERQKKVEGEAVVSTVLFSDRHIVIHDRVPIEKIEPLTEKQYTTDGCTALLDAIGRAVHHIGNVHKYAREEDVPEKTIFVITTDGQENSSEEYTYEKIKKLIEKQQEKYGWEFLFLGANMDVIAEAGKLGIRQDRAVRYECDSEGTAVNFETLDRAVGCVRMKLKLEPNWAEDIEDYRKNKRRGK